jgi:hypothetical protein
MKQTPSLLKPTAIATKIPFNSGKIRFGAYTYKPKEDISTYELALLIELFVFAFHPSVPQNYDYEDFVKSNKLERHFVKEKA